MLEAPLRDLGAWTEYFARLDIPVLRRTAARVRSLAQREADGGAGVDARTVAGAIADDPLMTLRVFSHLARRRGSAAAEVATAERALVMLGVGPFFRSFCNVPTVEERMRGDTDAHAGLVRVLRRAQRAARFACAFAIWRNDANAEEIVLAALLHDLAEMLLWCFAPALMRRIRALQAADPALRSTAAQKDVLRIELHELQVALARRWRLPALLVELMDHRQASGPRVRSIVLAHDLARHSTRSWDNPALPEDYRQAAALLSVNPAKVRELVGAPGIPTPAVQCAPITAPHSSTSDRIAPKVPW